MKIAILVCGNIVDEQQSDGYTHTEPVTKALYNPLFKCVCNFVNCSLYDLFSTHLFHCKIGEYTKAVYMGVSKSINMWKTENNAIV